MKTETLPEKTQKLVKQYMNLPNIGINTPYYINRSSHHFESAVKVGKGSVNEISNELLLLSKKTHTKIIEPNQWSEFAIKNHIGIDCSGFVCRIIEIFITENEKSKNKKLKDVIVLRGSFLQKIASMRRYLPNLNANTLTSNINCITINKVKDLRIADLIRFSGGHHVGFISKLIYEDNKLKEIFFLHSTAGSGVTEDKIIVIDEDKDLSQQSWQHNPNSIRQPENLYRRRINNNGIRRLNIFV